MLRSRFPVGECVTGCLLKSIDSITEVTAKGKRTGVKFVFTRGSAVLTHIEYNPKKKDMPIEKYNKEVLRIVTFMESLFFTYLTVEEVMEAKSSASDINEYIQNINAALKRVDAFNTPVDLKTLPSAMGTSLPRYVAYGSKYVPFIKKSDDIMKELLYSEYELKLINKKS